MTMTMRYARLAVRYGIIALCGGVFFREFTKLNAFTGPTALRALHVHYFALGMCFFWALMLTERLSAFTDQRVRQLLGFYRLGLNLAGLNFLLRGIGQVLGWPAAGPLRFAAAGLAGVGHILLGVCLVAILLQVSRKAG